MIVGFTLWSTDEQDHVRTEGVRMEASISQAARDALDRHQLQSAQANLVLVLCGHDAMEYTYKNGMLQALLDRVMALALHFDPDEEVEVIAYAEKQKECPPMTTANVIDYLAMVTWKGPKPEGGKKNLLKKVTKLFKGEELIEGLGTGNNAKPVLESLYERFQSKSANHDLPTLVIFVNDGSLVEAEGMFDLATQKLWSLPVFFYFAHFETAGDRIGLQTHFDGVEKVHENTVRNGVVGFVGELLGSPIGTARLEHNFNEADVDNNLFYDNILNPFAKWFRNARERLIFG